MSTLFNESQLVAGRIGWNDYSPANPHESDEWAATDRGWCHLATEDHPDRDDFHFRYLTENSPSGRPVCGNYCRYKSTTGPNGETIHAAAYVMRLRGNGYSADHCGSQWCETIEDAKQFIEAQVAAYLERMK